MTPITQHLSVKLNTTIHTWNNLTLGNICLISSQLASQWKRLQWNPESCCRAQESSDSAVLSLTLTAAETHSFLNPHFLPGVEFPKEFQAPKRNDSTKCRLPSTQLGHCTWRRGQKTKLSSFALFTPQWPQDGELWGHSWPAGGREKASLRNTLRSSPSRPTGCGTSCYFEPQGRKPTNKCSETIQTPQRANAFRSRVQSAVCVFVVRWSENQTITRVIVHGSMEWISRDAELGQDSVSCCAGLRCPVTWSCSSTGDRAERRSTRGRMWLRTDTPRPKNTSRRDCPTIAPWELPRAAFGHLTFLYFSQGNGRHFS